MSSNKIIAQLSNRKDISQKDNVTVTDVAGVINLINKGNVLIKFYSAGCHHCIEMVPAWTELINMKGSNNKNQPAIISIESEFLGNKEIHALLTKLDINVSGFPTIVFIKSDKSVINFEGPRTAHNMNKFINEHSIGKNSGHSSNSNKQKGGISKKYVVKLRNTKRNKRNTKRNTKRGGCVCGM